MSEVFRKVGLGYVYEPPERGIRFGVDGVKPKDGGYVAAVHVTADRPDLPKNIVRQVLNLTGGNGKRDLTNYLMERCGQTPDGPPVLRDDWLAMLEGLAQLVWAAQSEGRPLDWVGEDEPPSGSPFVVDRLVELGAINYLFGPGSQGKSWIERAILVHVQLGRPFCGLNVRQMETLHVDYEASRDQDTRRVRAILRGLGLPYQRFRRWEPADALYRQIGPLGKILDAERIGLYGVDSVGHAFGSPGEHSGGWEEAALNGGRALKALMPATPLMLDHVTAEASMSNKLAGRMSGAQRKFTDAQGAVWEVKKTQEAENAWLVAGLYHSKGNNGVKYHPMAIRLSFESDVWGRAVSVSFERDDEFLQRDADHAQRRSLKERVLTALEDGPMTIYQLTQQTGGSVDSVAATLRQFRGEGKTRSQEGGKGGRGNALTWVLENPKPESPLSNPPPSGFGFANPKGEYPNNENPNIRVNGHAGQPEATGVPVWGGDTPASDDDEVF